MIQMPVLRPPLSRIIIHTSRRTTIMPRVIHFELPVDNPDRATEFYRQVFGWTFTKWQGPQDYWLITTGTGTPGIDGGMLRRSHPGAGTVNTIRVASLDDAVGRIQDRLR